MKDTRKIQCFILIILRLDCYIKHELDRILLNAVPLEVSFKDFFFFFFFFF